MAKIALVRKHIRKTKRGSCVIKQHMRKSAGKTIRAVKGKNGIKKPISFGSKNENSTSISNLQDLLKKYETVKSQEIFWKIYEERLNDKSFKLTKPQQEIIDRLKSGSVIVITNEHHASGGDWTWDARPGGKIYRAFWNTMDAVLKGSGNTYAPKGFIISEREFDNFKNR